MVGQAQTALSAIVDLIESKEIRPALVIGTPSGFVGVDVAKSRLHDSMIPHIRIKGQRRVLRWWLWLLLTGWWIWLGKLTGKKGNS